MMAKIVQRANVDLNLTFTVNESEARALDALAGYGDDAFVKAFYQLLGKAYMERHESGMRSFLKAVRDEVPLILCRVDKARDAFAGKAELERTVSS